MDFEDNADERAFRSEVRAWLSQNAPRFAVGTAELAGGFASMLPVSRAWQAHKADAGYACIAWPARYGGRGGTPIQQVIFEEEETKHSLPPNPFHITLGNCIPTLFAYAAEDDLDRLVRPALRGEELWCQLFSEPDAGSDLAGIRTRACPEGNGWRVNGQKVWTSYAQYAEWGLLLARSDPDVAKHRGLTCFYLNMKSSGVEVRPIREMSGTSRFNEVYLTDVMIPHRQRLGGAGEGWKIALTTLMHERFSVRQAAVDGNAFEALFALASEVEWENGRALDDPSVRRRIADFYVQGVGIAHTRNRLLTALSRGEAPGPEASISKIVMARRLQEMATFGMELLGRRGVIAQSNDPHIAALQSALLRAPGLRIAGGTDEILRNIIAERVLGMPAEPRADKDIPFRKLVGG